jgi:hypothetical protein
MVSRGRGRVVRLSLGVDRDSLVGHIGDITVVVVGGVLNVLGPAIGKSNRVAARDGTVGIGCLGSVESGLGVVISNTILIGIRSGLLLHGGVAISGGGVVDNGSVGKDGGGETGEGNDRGVVRGWGMVDNWGVVWGRGSMVSGGSVHGVGNWGMDGVGNRGVIRSRGSMVSWGWGISNMVGNGSGSMDSGHWLLITSISMDRLRSSVGLAGNASVVSAMGLVDGVGDGRSIS